MEKCSSEFPIEVNAVDGRECEEIFEEMVLMQGIIEQWIDHVYEENIMGEKRFVFIDEVDRQLQPMHIVERLLLGTQLLMIVGVYRVRQLVEQRLRDLNGTTVVILSLGDESPATYLQLVGNIADDLLETSFDSNLVHGISIEFDLRDPFSGML